MNTKASPIYSMQEQTLIIMCTHNKGVFKLDSSTFLTKEAKNARIKNYELGLSIFIG